MFYVYEWFDLKTGEIFYVGKGTGRRYKVRKHNKFFNEFIKRNDCDSRIVKTFDDEKSAFEYEYERVNELRASGQCVCNIYDGGFGGTVEWWDDTRREQYSKNNAMKSEEQRKRMSTNNPMKDKKTAKHVGELHKRKICVGEKVYNGLVDVAAEYNVSPNSICFWLERGYSRDKKPCYYYGDKKPEVKIRTHNTTGKPVYVDDVLFNSVKDAASYLNVSRCKLQRSIEKGKECDGHKCKYGNQQPSRENP